VSADSKSNGGRRGRGSALAPTVPHGLVLKPEFRTLAGTFLAGTAVAVEWPGAPHGVVLTAQRWFGAAGGLSRAVPADQMPRFVRGVVLSDAFELDRVATAATALRVAGANGDDPRADLAAFRVVSSQGLHVAPLAKQTPAAGDFVWLSGPVRGAASDRRAHAACVVEVDDGFVRYVFETAELVLGDVAGAPVLDTTGAVVGVQVRGDVADGVLVGGAIAAPALHRALEGASE
jgi:hypothetical protein